LRTNIGKVSHSASRLSGGRSSSTSRPTLNVKRLIPMRSQQEGLDLHVNAILPPKSKMPQPSLPLLIKNEISDSFFSKKPPVPNRRPMSGIRQHQQMKAQANPEEKHKDLIIIGTDQSTRNRPEVASIPPAKDESVPGFLIKSTRPRSSVIQRPPLQKKPEPCLGITPLQLTKRVHFQKQDEEFKLECDRKLFFRRLRQFGSAQ